LLAKRKTLQKEIDSIRTELKNELKEALA